MTDATSNFWPGKNVFITGAFGFVGSWLAKHMIDRGANVFVFDFKNPSVSNFHYLGLDGRAKKIIQGSITDIDVVKKVLSNNEIDTCFHLAAQPIVGSGIESPIPTFDTNVRGTWNVLEACRTSEHVERVVVASSDKAYGKHKQLPYREDFALLPADPYSTSKACADILSQTFGKIYGMPVAITRCANIYGGGDFHFSRIFPSAAKAAVFGENPKLTSSGTAIRDLLHITDAVYAYENLALALGDAKVRGEAFNFAGETPISMIELVKKIISISGKSLQPEILGTRDERKEIDEQYLSCEKARKTLNWKPVMSLDEGIKNALEWYGNFFKSEFSKKISTDLSS